MNDISYKILPEELLTLINKGELDWHGGAFITSFECLEEQKATLGIHLLLDKSKKKEQNWRVHIEGLVCERIQREWSGDNILVYDQHFLIEEQQGARTELYIKNAPDNPHKFLADLYHHFSKKFEDYLLFEHYLNQELSLKALLKMPFGLFAKGPQFILEEIQYILETNGVITYFQGKHQIFLKELLLLSIGGSYFVAESFYFDRIS